MLAVKITAAEQTTDLVLTEINVAHELLTGTQTVNGYGVLPDPGDVRRAIRSASRKSGTRLNGRVGP
ncbi:MAG: hypothetical protein P4L50_11285 [Anaerolineaceae bacterium]|nr:hypothetical protein [Anaerolineaceae bacterium]